MPLSLNDLAMLGLTVLLAGLIGAEREFHDKSAGFRTLILIAVGAMLFTVFSLRLGGEEDPVRIAASIVAGVGFLGAGAILRDGGRVSGLTTAATIWLAAAIGMGVGAGEWALTSAATATILIVLMFFPRFEFWIDNLRHTTTYTIVVPAGPDRRQQLIGLFDDCRLRVRRVERSRSGEVQTYRILVHGRPGQHEEVVGRILELQDLIELRT
ncbi:MAG TPA: MgtC/SapB family protein [Anaerolineales bacterium]|nr:MgtC/SapB family protein [Anaerolineales bacterium]